MIYKTSVQCSPVLYTDLIFHCTLVYCVRTRWWHGNTSIRKRIKSAHFLMHFHDFFKFSNFRFRGNSSFLIDSPKLYIHFRFILIKYFWGISQYFWYVSLFFIRFLFFQILLKSSVSSYFWSVSAFYKNFKISVCWSAS